jgi:hypothetical protein
MSLEILEVSPEGKVTARKDPKEKGIDYTFDWEDYLGPLGDFITGVQWHLDNGLVVDTYQIVGYKVTVWISGGKPGATARLGCQIKSASFPAREPLRSIWVKLKPL